MYKEGKLCQGRPSRVAPSTPPSNAKPAPPFLCYHRRLVRLVHVWSVKSEQKQRDKSERSKGRVIKEPNSRTFILRLPMTVLKKIIVQKLQQPPQVLKSFSVAVAGR